ILLGGVVVKTLIEKDGTLLEIYQTRMDKGGKPIDLDRSEGRFLAYYKGFLDNEIWRKGRKVTVACTLEGGKTRKLGDIDYRYPYLRVREIHLWKEDSYTHEPYPWGPWNPWWDPLWHPYRYRHPPHWYPHR
ncbi:MAG: Slp family lipoprotein, partial [Desulfobacteraceae bacterium]